MDSYEATRIVFSRIQSLDPENVSKIMGFLLIQDHGEKEMIRLAFGPETLVHSLILEAHKQLNLSSSSSFNTNNHAAAAAAAAPTPSSPSPFHPANPISISRQNSTSSSSSRGRGVCASSWGFSDFHNNYESKTTPSPNPNPSSELLIDDYQHHQDQLYYEGMGIKNTNDLFYPDTATSPTNSSEDVIFPNWAAGQHRRSISVNDICLGSATDPLGSGFGWKPCLYYARGYCKNGTSCRFLHGIPDSPDPSPSPFPVPLVASPGSLDVMDDLLLRSRAQNFNNPPPSQLLPSNSFTYSTSQRAAAAAAAAATAATATAGLMLGEDVNQFGLARSRIDRNEMVNPGSRQIYLTFPADSTFKEEDVSNYFSIYGPVQDVRIPYQQKRMFGFVTFVYPETVKIILAKGNPHFVCESRVLVKPYKEKGKIPDKKQQQAERGEFIAPTSTNGHDPYELLLSMQMQSSPRPIYNNHELILRRKLEEQAELQQALELQSRRLMGLHLLDVNKQQFHRRNLSTGTAQIPSMTHPHGIVIQDMIISNSSPNQTSPTMLQENGVRSVPDQNLRQQVDSDGGDCGMEEKSNNGNCNNHDSVEHNLPDSPFASPTKAGGEPSSLVFSTAGEAARSISVTAAPSSSSNNSNSLDASLPANSSLDMTSFKSCFLELPRYSSGHGAVQM